MTTQLSFSVNEHIDVETAKLARNSSRSVAKPFDIPWTMCSFTKPSGSRPIQKTTLFRSPAQCSVMKSKGT